MFHFSEGDTAVLGGLMILSLAFFSGPGKANSDVEVKIGEGFEQIIEESLEATFTDTDFFESVAEGAANGIAEGAAEDLNILKIRPAGNGMLAVRFPGDSDDIIVTEAILARVLEQYGIPTIGDPDCEEQKAAFKKALQ